MRIRTQLKATSAILALLATGLFATSASADQVILDDLIVDGSVCAGLDCVNGESFGFDTLRLKENNLRIRFFDTSSSASFPSRDWQLTANDSSNGGLNKFSIDDLDSGRTPFTIEGNAPSHSLYVDDGGRLGLGTNTPVADVHVKSGNTPTLRLEQDGTSGFTPQTWDVAANEANFFIRDATNGSTLPFRIFPGAPSNAISIEASTGDIGLGITSPAADLHIEADGTNDTVIRLDGNVADWEITNNGTTGRLTYGATGGTDPFKMASNAVENLLRVGVVATNRVDIAGSLFTTGSCSIGCDEVFDADYDLPTITEQAELMFANKHLPNVGPTQTGPIDVTDKLLRMLNELEKAHIYIAELNDRIETLEAEVKSSRQ